MYNLSVIFWLLMFSLWMLLHKSEEIGKIVVGHPDCSHGHFGRPVRGSRRTRNSGSVTSPEQRNDGLNKDWSWRGSGITIKLIKIKLKKSLKRLRKITTTVKHNTVCCYVLLLLFYHQINYFKNSIFYSLILSKV